MSLSQLPFRLSFRCAKKSLTAGVPRQLSTSRLLSQGDEKDKDRKLPPLKLSKGESDDVLVKAQELIENDGWEITDDNIGLQKKFYFWGPKQAMRFIEKINEQANQVPHHPKWIMNWQPVTIRWHTSQPKGFSQKDIDMIAYTESAAQRLEERLFRRLGLKTPKDGDDVPGQKPDAGLPSVEEKAYEREPSNGSKVKK